jgi:hypothetical protein
VTVYTCQDCEEEVRGGQAILRSVSFRQVAYCRSCWRTNHASPVPGQRTSPEDSWTGSRQEA